MSSDALHSPFSFSGFEPARFETARPNAPVRLQPQQGPRIMTTTSPRQFTGQPEFEAKILESVGQLYGPPVAPEIVGQISDRVARIRQIRPRHLLKEDYERPAEWYKNECVYMFYPERFGVADDGTPNTFARLIPMLDYLQELGATTLYILPFLESPMIDAGFDVSDYKSVRSDLGGNHEFDLFIVEAHKRGLKIMVDLVLNHVSDKHAWFQAALTGDEAKIHYFVSRPTAPQYQVMHTDKGTIAVYQEDDGSESARRVIFPDFSENHWRKEIINGHERYFYHTFYPHQLDLNWRNPAVLYEAIEILGYWANKGIDIFRLDAIPFLVKKPGTDGESLPETHAVIHILNEALQACALRSVTIAEACQRPNDILPYYGREEVSVKHIDGFGPRQVKRTTEVQMAYHFPAMPAIWASMVLADSTPFWKAMYDTPNIPESAMWSMFLRVHDELTLEMVDADIRKCVYDALLPRGESFREGLGVSGRLASLLDNDTRRIALINSVLFSLPGVPVLYYGDEIGARNDRDFMMAAAHERAVRVVESGVGMKSFTDTRDLGRAPIAMSELLAAPENPHTQQGRIYQAIRKMIHVRKEHPALSRGSLHRVPTNRNSTFSYLRQADDGWILVVHNLKPRPRKVGLKMPDEMHIGEFETTPVDLLSDEIMPIEISVHKNAVQMTLKSYQCVWLKLQRSKF